MTAFLPAKNNVRICGSLCAKLETGAYPATGRRPPVRCAPDLHRRAGRCGALRAARSPSGRLAARPFWRFAPLDFAHVQGKIQPAHAFLCRHRRLSGDEKNRTKKRAGLPPPQNRWSRGNHALNVFPASFPDSNRRFTPVGSDDGCFAANACSCQRQPAPGKTAAQPSRIAGALQYAAFPGDALLIPHFTRHGTVPQRA